MQTQGYVTLSLPCYFNANFTNIQIADLCCHMTSGRPIFSSVITCQA